MIARLAGTLAEISADSAVIDVRGVGYVVLASGRTLGALPAVGGDVILLPELQVREDSMTLFAFGSASEREAFRQLTGVQGVGGRLALAILTILSPDELARAVSAGDKAMISRASGVGPKLAQRIALELQGKLGLPAALGPGTSAAANPATNDALSALANLGFKPAEAATAVARAAEELGPDASLDALVRGALKKAAR
jgi:Holliday junction DNA helicase RuvA